MIHLGKDREIFNNVVVYRNFFRKLWYITYMRSYLDIILTYSSLFLPTFFNARLFVTTSWLRIYSWWVSKSHPRKRKTKENRQTMDFGVSAFSIDLAIVWILNFCVFLCVWVFWECFYWCTFEGVKQTKHLSGQIFYLWHPEEEKMQDGKEEKLKRMKVVVALAVRSSLLTWAQCVRLLQPDLSISILYSPPPSPPSQPEMELVLWIAVITTRQPRQPKIRDILIFKSPKVSSYFNTARNITWSLNISYVKFTNKIFDFSLQIFFKFDSESFTI